MNILIYLCILINLTFANDKFLNKFQICKRSHPNLNECLKNAIQKALPFLEYGVKEFEIPSMQPMEIEAWNVESNEVIPFEQKYKNIMVYNKALSTVDEVHSSITENDFAIHIKGNLPFFKFTTQYQYDNAIFYQHNLTGNGSLILALTGNVFFVNMSGIVDRSGSKPTLQIVSSFHENTIEAADVNIGHIHIAVNVKTSEHFSKHWKVFFENLSVEYSKIYAFGFKNIANAIFSQLDYDKIFPK